MVADLTPILRAVLDGYALEPGGIHGVAHWARVLENGLRLAGTTGADVAVVQLFAVLHDSRRWNDDEDPEHGPRAAEFARTLRGRLFELPDPAFALLHRACAGHTRERTHPDATVRTCWDSDRLDLGRVGTMPDPYYLGTDAAKDPAMIRWADGRACRGFVPALVEEQWKIVIGR